MTAGCEATPLPEPAFCISSGGGSNARRDPAGGHGFAKAGVSQVTAPFLLQHPQVCCWPCVPLLLLCSSCLHLFPLLQLCSVGLCSVLLLEVPPAALAGGKRRSPRASLAALLTWKRLSPLVLQPGLLSLSSSSSPRDLREQSKPGESPRPPPGGAGALLPLALLFNFLFPNQKWPKQRDGEFST